MKKFEITFKNSPRCCLIIEAEGYAFSESFVRGYGFYDDQKQVVAVVPRNQITLRHLPDDFSKSLSAPRFEITSENSPGCRLIIRAGDLSKGLVFAPVAEGYRFSDGKKKVVAVVPRENLNRIIEITDDP